MSRMARRPVSPERDELLARTRRTVVTSPVSILVTIVVPNRIGLRPSRRFPLLHPSASVLGSLVDDSAKQGRIIEPGSAYRTNVTLIDGLAFPSGLPRGRIQRRGHETNPRWWWALRLVHPSPGVDDGDAASMLYITRRLLFLLNRWRERDYFLSLCHHRFPSLSFSSGNFLYFYQIFILFISSTRLFVH